MLCKLLNTSSRILTKKSVFGASVLIFALSSIVAQASTVNATPPYGNVVKSGETEGTIYYALAGLDIDTVPNEDGTQFTAIDPAASRSGLVRLTLNTTKKRVFIKAKTTGSSLLVPLFTLNGTDCSGNANCLNPLASGWGTIIVPSSGVDFTVGFYLQQLCSNSSAVQGCGGGAILDTSDPDPFYLTVYFSDDENIPTPDTGADTATINIQLQTEAPSVQCPDLNTIYFPGDSEILLDTNTIGFSYTGTKHGAPSNIIVIGANGSDPNEINYQNNPIFQRPIIGSGPQSIPGFVNRNDSASSNLHRLRFAVRDSSGARSDFGCALNSVQTSPIGTFLNKSSCFIATAAFRSGEDAPVLMLRRFRDQILLKNDWGQGFVRWYYAWSPSAAKWLMEHPAFRYPVLFALIPVQILGWLSLHLGVATLLLAISLLTWIKVTPRRSQRRSAATLTMSNLLITFLLTSSVDVHAQETSNQPYIDSIQRKIEKTEGGQAKVSSEIPDPYIQKQQEKLKPSNSRGYTETIQKRLNEKKPTSDSPESFIEMEQKKLADTPSTGSAIQDLAEGKKLKPNMGPPPTWAAGFKMGTSQSRQVSNTKSPDGASFASVYGKSFTPDVKFFYEYRPFDHDWAGSFGILFNFGLAYDSGFGVFKYVLSRPVSGTFSTQSRTQLKFFTIPLTAGAIYRFNLSRYIKPYATLGPAVIGYAELRNDKISGNRGQSRGYYGEVGVNVLLDWVSRGSSWDLYSGQGIKHYYLTIDYSRLASIAGDVDFTISGINAGLTFEL